MAATSTAKGAGRRKTDPDDLNATRAETGRAMRDLDARQRAAYEEGRRNGDRPGPEEPDSVHAAFDAGYQDYDSNRPGAGRPGETPAKASAAPAGGGSTLKVGEQGASFLLGLLGYALAINYLRYGWPGVTGWLSAKFTNNVTLGQTKTASTTAVVTPAQPAPASPGAPMPASPPTAILLPYGSTGQGMLA